MAAEYATLEDVTKLGRKFTADELEKAEALLPIASAKLSVAAKEYGKCLDIMIADDPELALVAKEIIVKSVIRAIDCSADNSPPAVQASQAAMGYSVSMTYLNSGQSLYFLKNELKELGIIRQRWGAMEVYGCENDNKGH